MHLSKKALYFGIIAFSAALLVLQDWPNMLGSTGTTSLAWLVKMFVDIAFAGMGLIRLVGPALFAEDEGDDEVAIHEEDLHVSDTALFGLFLVNLVGNAGYHGYRTVMATGGESFYFSLWVMAEGVAILLSYVLWTHAVKVQRRLARQSRAASGNAFRQAS